MEVPPAYGSTDTSPPHFFTTPSKLGGAGVTSPARHEGDREEARGGGTGGGGGDFATGTNLAKVCLGSGMLALPFAFAQAGLLFSVIGCMVIAAWNYYSCDRLVLCRELLDSVASGAEDLEPNAVYPYIGRKAFGPWGSHLVNGSIFLTLFGCCCTFILLATQLIGSTPFGMWFDGQPQLNTLINTLICAAIVLPFCCVKSVSFLSRTSAVGILALLASFIVLFFHGITTRAWEKSATVPATPLGLWPRDFDGFARFFGIANFCFGIPPLAFPIHGAMDRPERFRRVLSCTLMGVVAIYVVASLGMVWLYGMGVPANILGVLPYTSLAAVVRVCIALVGLCSYPLCIVPLGDSIEAVIPWRTHREAKRPPFSLSPSACKSPSFHSTKYSSIVDEGGSSSYQTSVPETVARARRLAVRLSIVASTLICANVVPCFGTAVALIGAFTVTIISFVLPPLFHLTLYNSRLRRNEIVMDGVMFLLGVCVCGFSTYLTADSSIKQLREGHCQ